jgi:hypothetical protein
MPLKVIRLHHGTDPDRPYYLNSEASSWICKDGPYGSEDLPMTFSCKGQLDVAMHTIMTTRKWIEENGWVMTASDMPEWLAVRLQKVPN